MVISIFRYGLNRKGPLILFLMDFYLGIHQLLRHFQYTA
jgi:hypothetical protein